MVLAEVPIPQQAVRYSIGINLRECLWNIRKIANN